MWREDIVSRTSSLSGLPELIDSLGGASDMWFEEAGLDVGYVNDPNKYMPVTAFYKLIELAALRLKTPDFGLRWAKRNHPEMLNFGPVAVIAMMVSDLRHFLKIWIDYYLIHTNGSYMQIVEDEDQGFFRIIIDHIVLNEDICQIQEYTVASLYLAALSHGQLPLAHALGIGFAHRPVSDRACYEAVFDCPIEFDADQTYIDFPIEFLQTKLGFNFKPGQKMVNEYIARVCKTSVAPNMSMSGYVAQLLPAIFGIGKSDIGSVAGILGIGVKKLQRLLRDESTSYSEILGTVRQSMALQLLRESNIAIGRISGLLDYGSVISFGNACKRWTNMSPREYRKLIQHQPLIAIDYQTRYKSHLWP